MGASTVDEIEFVRDGRNYQWHYAPDLWIQIDVDHLREHGEIVPETWLVTGANRCRRVEITLIS